MYKKASQIKLRVQTQVGLLSVEQLWDLKVNQLINAIKSYNDIIKKEKVEDLDFLETTPNPESINQLCFDILKDIYLTKKAEKDDADNALSKKEHNEKILSVIKAKQEARLSDLSVEELEKLLQ